MYTDANRKISIIAYYLSKFDMDAVRALGFTTYSGAFRVISERFGKSNNYMKLRRDEFDAIVSTVRQGWNKRSPARGVLQMHEDLKNFTFEELTSIVTALIDDDDSAQKPLVFTEIEKKIVTSYTEEEYESLINQKDDTATIKRHDSVRNVRVYDRRIQNGLKQLYNYRCQLCGATATVLYNVDVSEAHHIDYFTKSMNNNPSNIIILCPDHHRVVHKAHAFFNRDMKQFEYDNARIEKLLFNLHL